MSYPSGLGEPTRAADGAGECGGGVVATGRGAGAAPECDVACPASEPIVSLKVAISRLAPLAMVTGDESEMRLLELLSKYVLVDVQAHQVPVVVPLKARIAGPVLVNGFEP